MFWGRILGTLLGFVAGRIVGAVLGFLVGYWFDKGIAQNQGQRSPHSESAEQNNPAPKTYSEACDVLGVNSSTSSKEIKKRYHHLMRQYHPDRLNSKEMSAEERAESEQKAKNVRAAYDIIKKLHKSN